MAWPISTRFWAAQSSAAAAARTAIARKGGARFGSSFARKEELWSSKGSHYLRGHKGLAGRFAGIRVDPALQAIIADELARVAPALQGAFDEHLGKLAFKAWREWPVATGLSKSLLALEYSSSGTGRFTGSLSSRAPYTVFIKGQPHRLIDRVGLDVASRIADDALTDLARG